MNLELINPQKLAAETGWTIHRAAKFLRKHFFSNASSREVPFERLEVRRTELEKKFTEIFPDYRPVVSVQAIARGVVEQNRRAKKLEKISFKKIFQ